MTKETFQKKLGKNIANIRKKAGYNQAQFALKCDKEKQNINRLEKGKGNPTAAFLFDIANALNVSVRDLFDFE